MVLKEIQNLQKKSTMFADLRITSIAFSRPKPYKRYSGEIVEGSDLFFNHDILDIVNKIYKPYTKRAIYLYIEQFDPDNADNIVDSGWQLRRFSFNPLLNRIAPVAPIHRRGPAYWIPPIELAGKIQKTLKTKGYFIPYEKIVDWLGLLSIKWGEKAKYNQLIEQIIHDWDEIDVKSKFPRKKMYQELPKVRAAATKKKAARSKKPAKQKKQAKPKSLKK